MIVGLHVAYGCNMSPAKNASEVQSRFARTVGEMTSRGGFPYVTHGAPSGSAIRFAAGV